MLARDVNSIPTQYRTWVVPNAPDYTGQFYTGLKSGPAPFVDVLAFAITDDSVIADFNLPLPADWNAGAPIVPVAFPIQLNLPFPVEDSQLAIIDGYAYMFGGKLTDKIFRADINNPANWFDTGATLPTPLYGSSLAIVSDTIYLFGGDDGYGAGEGPLGVIYSAPVSDPLTWTDTGFTLPEPLLYSSLGMFSGKLYLFGGLTPAGATDVIYSAATSNPLNWIADGYIPVPVYGSSVAQLDGYWFLYGGQLTPDAATGAIWTASTSDPTFWYPDGYLPWPCSFGQFVTAGNDGYLFGPMPGSAPMGYTHIVQSHISAPETWIDIKRFIPANISHSQVAIIYDRIWFFGGSGETGIFACNQNLKYPLYSSVVEGYGQATRVLFPMTNNVANPFLALGFPYWKTDYSM